ncbi:MAG: glycosyltransferase family 2 protein [Bacillota bacterium]
MKKISLLIPVYNEEEVLPLLYEELGKVAKEASNYDFELFFIDDGSSDNSLCILRDMQSTDSRVNYISFSRNFGKETALAAGFDYVTGDAVIILDADLQHPPELIPDMIKCWEEGYDDVYARRRIREGESWLKKFTSHAYYKLLQKMTKVEIQKDTGDFRLLDRRALEALKKLREKQRYTKGMFTWVGFNKKEILFDSRPRVAGKTKWNYLQLMNLALEGITSYSTAPLRLATIVGFFVSIFSIVYMIVTLIQSLIWKNPVKGYPSIMVMILFLGGVQLVCLGIIGEYVGRIFNETKHRPLYIVSEHNNEKCSVSGV